MKIYNGNGNEVENFITRKLTDEEREEEWQKVVDGRRRHFDYLYKQSGGTADVFIKLFSLEFDGGYCYNCGVPWEKVEVDNRYSKGSFYQPRCDCFMKCPACKTYLYDLQYTYRRVSYCDNCGFKLLEEIDNKKRYGREFEEWFDELPYKQQQKERFKR